MADTIINVDCWAGKYRIAGYTNAMALEYGAEPQDNTRMTNGTRQWKGGLKNVGASIDGLFDTGDIDKEFFDAIGLDGVPLVFTPDMPGALGSRAFGFYARQGEYSPTGTVGEILRFAAIFDAAGGPLVRGQIGHVGSEGGDGNEDGVQLGAVATGKKLYAGLHVLSISGGGALTVSIGSDNADTFGSPTTRGTFAAKSEPGSEWLTPVAGPITDDWFRASWTLTGTGPAAEFIVFFGIA